MILDLIHQGRWAALATCGPQGPIASQVAYAPEPELEGVVLLLSQLAAHTRALLANPRAALCISEPDDGRDDPQTLRRIALSGHTRILKGDEPAYEVAAHCYLARFPAARRLFEFSDFLLVRLQIEQARYVGGFAAARTLTGAALRDLAVPP